MDELSKSETEKEIAELKNMKIVRRRSRTKSPVKDTVRTFESKTKHETSSSPERRPSNSKQRNSMKSPTRSVSPGVPMMRSKSPGNDPRMSSPTRNPSPGVYKGPSSPAVGSEVHYEVQFSPNRSVSPAIFNPGRNSPMRSKSPGMGNDSRVFSPNRSVSPASFTSGRNSLTRSKSPATGSEVLHELVQFNPNRSKSPGVYHQGQNSPLGSKSPTMVHESRNPIRTKSPGMAGNELRNRVFSPTGGKSPVMSSEVPPARAFSPARSLSPAGSTKRPSKLFSPAQSPISAAEPSPSPDKPTWTYKNNSWEKSGPEFTVSWETGPAAGETPREEVGDNPQVGDSPQVGDTVNVSWEYDNVEFVMTPEDEEVHDENDGGGLQVDEMGVNEWEEEMHNNKEQVRFRNVLNYNIRAWENNDDISEEHRPKKADEFIQRMCDEVRDDVEFLCEMRFAAYNAVSYRVQVAGDRGIFYYVKVNVWQSYCLHLRIFSDKNGPASVPVLQAVLERTQRDNGNIVFF